ncbi:MAG TPA: hypothetical protein VMV44_06045 [Rectinemataceae bacterium]|nr:hypothetical protein [Rectinemataceae bacterium]
MRRKVVFVLVLALVAALAFGAPSKGISLESLTPPGTLMADAGIGWGGLSGGVEFMFAQIKIADVLPITFGAAGRAFVDPGIFYTSFSTFTFGAGGFGTAHVGFKELKLPSGFSWLSNVDTYIGLGVGFASATANTSYSSYTFKPGIGISTFEGASYYLSDKLAITGEYGYIGRVTYDYSLLGYTTSYGWPLYYSTIGVTFKF